MVEKVLRSLNAESKEIKQGRMSMFKKEFAFDICACLGFIVFYITAYRDMLFQKSLLWALNLVPLPTLNARFYIPGQFYWFPGNIGSPAQPNIANWLPYVFVMISGGDLVLAEKFLISTSLVSCFTMYFFLSNHFKGSRLARFSAALIFGFGPAMVLDFTDVTLWGYAAVPIVFNYMLNILEGKRKIKDILLLGLSLSFMTAFLPQILLLIFISFLIFLVVRMLPLAEKLKYFRKVAVSFSLAVLVLVVTSPYLISGAYQLMVHLGWIPASGIVSPLNLSSSSQPSLYFATYSNQEIVNTIRLIGGSPGNHLPDGSWIGFVLPILAFASLLLVQKGKKMLNLLALTLVSLFTITIIYGIHLQAGWALWLLYKTPISLWYYPERPLYIVTFAYSVMISVTIERLLSDMYHFRFSDYFRQADSILRRNLRKIFSILIVALLLTSVFLFAPVFNEQLHQERYNPLPQVYSNIQNWLNSHNDGENYRVMFLPTDSFSLILGDPDVFEYATGYASSLTQSYVDFVYNQLVTCGTHNLGSILAPASVKYIILATLNPNTLWNGTSALAAPLQPDLSGPVRYSSGGVQGDPVDIEKILNEQNDLTLVHVDKDFRVYENIMYSPKISVFSNALYIVGSEDALSVLPRIPDFSANKDMLIFAYQNPSLAKELPEACSSILFFNADVSDYANMLSSSVGVRTAYEDAMNIVSSKKQLYLFVQDSPTFSRSVTIPSGQWWVALRAPEPVMVNPSMGIIDLNQGQTFLITKENFKPAHNPPSYDFDLANYYFYTSTGGNYTMTIKGSGALWAYVAYNSTIANIAKAPFNYVDLPDNGTFTINLPPNTIFQPIVNAYNPAMGHNITDNIDELTIENKLAGENSILTVDGANTTSAQTSEANGWREFSPLNLSSGTHNLTISNGMPNGLVAIYNTDNLAEIFDANASVGYEFSKLSETSYSVNVNADVPVFLSLSESYHPNWDASSGTQKLVHFTAFSYSNGFYLNKTGVVDVTVNYEPPLLNQVYVAQQILFAATGLFAVALSIAPRIRRKIKNWNGD